LQPGVRRILARSEKVVLLALIISEVMAGVLLWGGIEKVRDLRPLTSTLQRLGVHVGKARAFAALLLIAELGIAFSLIFLPDKQPTQVGTVVLGCIFAFAGIVALRQAEPISCNCFGGGTNSYLGVTQIVALLAWVPGAAALHLGLSDGLPVATGVIRLLMLGLAFAGVRGLQVWRATAVARGDRLSAMEMYLWHC
jgi:hypothetical protein